MAYLENITTQKMKFSNKDFFSKCDQTRCFLRIWSHLLEKSLKQNFIFCAVCSMCKNYNTKEIWEPLQDILYAL